MAHTNPYRFFVDAYGSERVKTLSVWSEFSDEDLGFRPQALARSPLEHMVHQCVSEDTWMQTMLHLKTSGPALPERERRVDFMRHYAAASADRLDQLRTKPVDWWDADTTFFDTARSRAWVFLRRLNHSAHHRGQLTVYLRLLGKPLYSIYGPTAETGGLFASGAATIYRYESSEALLDAEASGGTWPPLPGPGLKPATERP